MISHERGRHERIVRETSQLTALSFSSSDEAIDAVLAVMARLLDARTVFLARFDDIPGGQRILNVLRVLDNGGISLQTGSAGPLAQTYCNTVSASREPLIVDDTQNDLLYDTLPSTHTMGIRSYVGVPLMYSGGEIYGTLCGIDAVPSHVAEQPEIVELLQILARFLISQIEREEANGRLQAMIDRQRLLEASIAHDLRSPLTSILAMCQLMLKKGDALEIRKVQQWMHLIEQCTHRLIGQVNNLLAYSQVSANAIFVDLKKQSIEPVIRSSVDLMATQAQDAGIDLVHNTQLREEHDVLIAEEHMHRILQNLIGNAIKFTQQGGRIIVVASKASTLKGEITMAPDIFDLDGTLPWVTAHVSDSDRHDILKAPSLPNGRWATINVIDNGKGIAAKDLLSIFDEYRQVVVGDRTYQDGEGVGLGLAIVKQLVSQMNGYVSVRSDVARGSCFTIFLPQSADS